MAEQTAAQPAGYRPGGEAEGLGILGIDHVGIAVADLDQAVALHVDVLGLTELHREENVAMGVVEVMLGAGPGEVTGAATTQIQLLAPLGPDSPIGRFLDRAGPGLQHLAYRVRHVESAASFLRAKGFRLLYDAPRPGTRDSRINFVHPKDAGGVLIELVQSAGSDSIDPTARPTSPAAPADLRPGNTSASDSGASPVHSPD